MRMQSLLQPEIDQAEINAVLRKACEQLRGLAEPSITRSYILALLLYKSISDVWKNRLIQYDIETKGDWEQIKRLMSLERFFVPEGQDFDAIFKRRDEANLAELIDQTLGAVEDANKNKLAGVFGDIGFHAVPLLGDLADRRQRLKNLIEAFADPRLNLSPPRVGDHDVIGDAAQYLLEYFASDAGKKGGEFFTPPGISTLLAKLLRPEAGARIYDPVCGSGSLLIRLGDESEGQTATLYGQESKLATWILCRLNLLLHGKDNARIELGDTLDDPKLLDEDGLAKFDIVVADPMFSLDQWNAEYADNDRFHRFDRGAPPRGKPEYALISHVIESTASGRGKAAVIVPHGVLFRGGAEGQLRRRLIEENILECVVGLPPNLFYGAGIPAAILLFNRGKKTTDILFIDASREYFEAKNQSKLRPSDIEKIVSTYCAFASTESYARRATFEQVKENGFNLNLSRYVDPPDKEEIDLKTVEAEIESLEMDLAEARAEMKEHLKALGLS